MSRQKPKEEPQSTDSNPLRREYMDYLRERLSKPASAAEYLSSAAEYLSACLEESSGRFLAALRTAARRHGISRVAQAGKLRRENLYRMLDQEANPSFRNISVVIAALGLRLGVTPQAAGGAPADSRPPSPKAS